MATEDYHANWRGARRYQFDEEVRRKRVANDAKFRSVKHADPEKKLSVLVEDLGREADSTAPLTAATERLGKTLSFPAAIFAVFCLTFVIVFAM